jgi:hypothetical protein
VVFGEPKDQSRRDSMKVARQFIAWNRLEKGVPSCRDGAIFIPGCALDLRALLTD